MGDRVVQGDLRAELNHDGLRLDELTHPGHVLRSLTPEKPDSIGAQVQCRDRLTHQLIGCVWAGGLHQFQPVGQRTPALWGQRVHRPLRPTAVRRLGDLDVTVALESRERGVHLAIGKRLGPREAQVVLALEIVPVCRTLSEDPEKRMAN